MDLAERRIYIVKSLPKSKENFIKPVEIGGHDRSYHSNDLFALCKLGIVEKNRYYIKEGTKGHWRYKLTSKGDVLQELILQSNTLKEFRKDVLSKKNGIRARYF